MPLSFLHKILTTQFFYHPVEGIIKVFQNILYVFQSIYVRIFFVTLELRIAIKIAQNEPQSKYETADFAEFYET